MSSSPPPESGLEEEAEEVVINPVKPEAAAAEGKGDGDGVHINVKITSQTAPEVLIRVKRDVTMQFIMEKYCGKHSLVPETVLFLNDEGGHLRDVQTAEEAGLEDGSTISIHLRVDGGSGRCSV